MMAGSFSWQSGWSGSSPDTVRSPKGLLENSLSRAWGLRNGIAGEIQLAIVFCNAVREPVIQALRREGTPHHHNPAPDGKHN